MTHFFIESNETNSYNPVAAFDGQRVWVFYLNNKDNYYRVYARFLENNVLSDELLISDKGSFDVNTINVASKNGELSVIWCEWKDEHAIPENAKNSSGCHAGIKACSSCSFKVYRWIFECMVSFALLSAKWRIVVCLESALSGPFLCNRRKNQ